jgi:hypothetical protein
MGSFIIKEAVSPVSPWYQFKYSDDLSYKKSTVPERQSTQRKSEQEVRGSFNENDSDDFLTPKNQPSTLHDLDATLK